mgnify:CR=1 FL=1
MVALEGSFSYGDEGCLNLGSSELQVSRMCPANKIFPQRIINNWSSCTLTGYDTRLRHLRLEGLLQPQNAWGPEQGFQIVQVQKK